MAANHMTAEQAQQHWRQIGHLTTHTGGGGGWWWENLTDEERLRMTACAPNPWAAQAAGAVTFATTLPAVPPSLSDADIERIARRVVELLAARGTTP